MRTRTVIFAAAVALVTATPLAGQGAPHDQPPAVVALVPSLPDSSAAAVVLRRAGDAGDVILLRETDASVAGLAAAIAVLVQSRGRHRDLAGSLRLTIQSAAVQRRVPAGVADQLEQVLRRARRTAIAVVDGVGPARSATVPLTRFRSR